jgi:diacylglycerol kinase family enzyme
MPAPPLETLERLAEAHAGSRRAPAKRMLIIVNPYATTVSDRLRHLVVYALKGRYDVEAVDTTGRNHATEICREAGREGYDVVVSFGGDGTVNEAANGLAGSHTPLTALPGGATNVYSRIIGIPPDIVDATEHLLRIADDFNPRRVDLAHVNGRHFCFSSGMGLDATVVKRVDEHPKMKTRMGEYYFTYAAVTSFLRHYLIRAPRVSVEVAGEQPMEGVTSIVQNTTPFTYFGLKEIEVAEQVSLHDGLLGGVVLRRAAPYDVPTIIARLFTKRLSITRSRLIDHYEGTPEVVVRSLTDRPIPLQVDGDHIGDVTEARYGVTPNGLLIVS